MKKKERKESRVEWERVNEKKWDQSHFLESFSQWYLALISWSVSIKLHFWGRMRNGNQCFMFSQCRKLVILTFSFIPWRFLQASLQEFFNIFLNIFFFVQSSSANIFPHRLCWVFFQCFYHRNTLPLTTLLQIWIVTTIIEVW